MKLAILEVVYDSEVIGLSKSRGDFYIRDERFKVKDKSPFFASEMVNVVLGFGPENGENLLREFLALGAERGIYLPVPFYGVKNFDLYPVCDYIIKNFPNYEIFTSNEEIFYRCQDLKINLVREKISGRLPTALEIIKGRKKQIEIPEDFKYYTGFRFISGEEI